MSTVRRRALVLVALTLVSAACTSSQRLATVKDSRLTGN
jgi:hypothetical protein